MPARPDTASADSHPVRAIVLWTTFTGLLALGVVLYFTYGGRIVPLLDAMPDR